MCGRYSEARDLSRLRKRVPFTMPAGPPLPLRYNIAPTQQAPVIRHADDHHELQLFRWGLTPTWAKLPTTTLINVRAETAAQKFRSQFRQRRCLVPADGFYEWAKDGARKQPYRFTMPDALVFCFAGLYDDAGTSAERATSAAFAILTTAANDLVRPIHHRMPVILAEPDYERWLDPTLEETTTLAECLRPFPADEMKCYPVSTAVNSPRNDDRRCIEPLSPPSP